MTKKLMSMIIGRKADARIVVLTDKPIHVVKTTYNPAPAKPAPPVPLPQAASPNLP